MEWMDCKPKFSFTVSFGWCCLCKVFG